MRRVKTHLDHILGWALVILMGASVLNVLWQVFTRFVLGNPSSYTEELARYFLIWIGVLAAAYGVGVRAHLAIDLLPLKLKGRRRKWLEIFIQASIAVFALLVLVIGGMRLVSTVFYLQQASAALGIMLGYVYLVLPLAGVIILFYSTMNLVAALRGDVGPDTSGVEAGEPHAID